MPANVKRMGTRITLRISWREEREPRTIVDANSKSRSGLCFNHESTRMHTKGEVKQDGASPGIANYEFTRMNTNEEESNSSPFAVTLFPFFSCISRLSWFPSFRYPAFSSRSTRSMIPGASGCSGRAIRGGDRKQNTGSGEPSLSNEPTQSF